MKRTFVLLLTIHITSTAIHLHGVPLTDAEVVYTQNFDTLAEFGPGQTWVNNTTIPGWHLFKQTLAPATLYNSTPGTSSTGTFYSFSTRETSDRALGSIGSGSFWGWIAASFQNASPSTFTSVTLNWNGEQWRNGGALVPQAMNFEYGFGQTFETVSSWMAPGGSFDWMSPVFGGAASAVDGNAIGKVPNVGGELTGLTWESGDTLWVRWIERDDLNGDHGLAIDDFSLIPHVAAAQAPSTVPDSLPFEVAGCALLGVVAAGSMRVRNETMTLGS
ncbi:MAG TPA: hypothetical protein VEH04_06665 [Verrucomicrobiae bacterium]|nr:hypothetical protein [Verrucomicrobiae bacterium]